MPNHYQSFSSRPLLFIIACMVAGFILLAGTAIGQIAAEEGEQSILQGSIHIQPVKNVPGDLTGKIQPGTQVKISVEVENKGERLAQRVKFMSGMPFHNPSSTKNQASFSKLKKRASRPLSREKRLKLPSIPPI